MHKHHNITSWLAIIILALVQAAYQQMTTPASNNNLALEHGNVP
ncbi:MAG: hypothetical protein WA996_24030 [Candidatus Promineifilaceae bacterium]